MTKELVVQPVRAELDRYARARAALTAPTATALTADPRPSWRSSAPLSTLSVVFAPEDRLPYAVAATGVVG